MNQPLVKVCGITRSQDACLAVELGANALGFIFYDQSARFIQPDSAASIVTEVKERSSAQAVMRVGVFVNPSLKFIRGVLSKVDLTHIQLHGVESQEFCRQVRAEFADLKLIKAIRLGTDELTKIFPVDFLLLDHAAPGAWGGTGQTISWASAKEWKQSRPTPLVPFFLAGGINAENIKSAVEQVLPDGIDLSSGLEISPGIKSELKMRSFFEALSQTTLVEKIKC